MHIALLGDSSFDNARYSEPELSVAEHLMALLAGADEVTLLAVDSCFVDEVADQAGRIPSGATHLVLSVGGNDALSHSYLLQERAETVGEALSIFCEPLRRFAKTYRQLATGLSKLGLPLALCTIYEGAFPPAIERATRVGVSMFNDVIQRVGRSLDAHIVELREVCTDLSDFTMQIEPSGVGGRKIAHTLKDVLDEMAVHPAGPDNKA